MPSWLLAGVALIGLGGFTLIRYARYEAQRLIEEALNTEQTMVSIDMEEMMSAPEYTGALFDCPECNMPAEVATYVTMWDPDSQIAVTYVVISCLSDHDLLTVTEDWFVDNVLSQLHE